MFGKLFKWNKPQPQKHQQISPEEEVQSARRALLQKDMPHAFFHISWALTSNPSNQDWLQILETINSQIPDLQALVPADNQMDYARGACLAWLFGRRGDYQRAFPLMVNVLQAMPDERYWSWLANWFSAPEQLSAVSIDSVIALLARIGSQLPPTVESTNDPQLWQIVEIISTGVDGLLKQRPNATALIPIQSALIRRMGRLEEALTLAQTAFNTDPDVSSAIMLAIAYRALGQIDKALEAYYAARQFNPTMLSIQMDIADVLLDAGRTAEAMEAYKRIIAVDKANAWANPHYLYCQYLLEPNSNWQVQLKRYLDSHRQDDAVQQLFRRMTPYVGYYPEPTDATINTLRQIDRDTKQKAASNDAPAPKSTKGIAIGVSSLESPSAYLALDLYSRQRTGFPATMSAATIPQPDPRVPHGQVDFVLWRYDGVIPSSAVERPAEAIAQKVATIARIFATPNIIWAQARNLANELSAADLNDLLGVMVYPTECPADIPIWDWIYHLQIVAALTIANLDRDMPWEDSVRKRALFSLMLGPMDWTVEAAIIALTDIAKQNPVTRKHIFGVFSELITNLPRSGAIPYLSALVYCGLQLPDLTPTLRTRLESLRNAVN